MHRYIVYYQCTDIYLNHLGSEIELGQYTSDVTSAWIAETALSFYIIVALTITCTGKVGLLNSAIVFLAIKVCLEIMMT